jgi:arylsulfatase A-like enzyme
MNFSLRKALLAACALIVGLLSSRASAAPPNILFILADDLGWGDLGCYGQKRIQTPNLDRLASEGTRFTDVYAGASVCAPSRGVLMTGRHLGHARVRGNGAAIGGEVFPEYGTARRVGLAAEDVTVAMQLKAAGYATGLIGKWGLGERGTAGVPPAKGFDESFGYLNQDHASDYYPDHLIKDGQRVPVPENADGKKGAYTHDLFATAALDFVERHRAGPFFLYLAYTLPHQDYVIPSTAPYEAEDWPQDEKVHAAMVTRLDRDVGRMLARLQELGLAEKTIVFFASDNGAVARREGLFDSAGPFRSNKGNQWEGGLRVPMLVRWPGQVPVGRVSDTPWSFADVLPTLCAISGAKTPPEIDGINVLPTLRGEAQPALAERPMYWEQYSKGGFWQSVRLGPWKGHRWQVGDRFELYDLATDTAETKNVAAEHPEIVQRLRAAMAAAHTPSPHWSVDATPPAKKPKAKP